MAAAQLDRLVAVVKQNVLAAALQGATSQGRYARSYPTVIVDLPCTLYSVQTSTLPLASAVAANLKFSPRLQQLAALVMERVWFEAGGPSRGLPRVKMFNGIDLRLAEGAAGLAGSRGAVLGQGGAGVSNEALMLQLFLQVRAQAGAAVPGTVCGSGWRRCCVLDGLSTAAGVS